MNGISAEQKADMLLTLERALKIVQALPEIHGCVNCENFDSKNGCLTHGQMPPADYQQSNECQQWQEMIPF